MAKTTRATNKTNTTTKKGDNTTMKNTTKKNTNTKNTNTKNTNTTKKGEKTMKNINTMTKAELIEVIKEQNERMAQQNDVIETLTGRINDIAKKYETLRDSLGIIRKATKSFVNAMNDAYRVEDVRNALGLDVIQQTTKIENDTKKNAPENPAKTTKTANDAVAKTTIKDEETAKTTKRKWMTKEEYKAQFTPEQIEEYKQKKQYEARVKSYVANQMREEAQEKNKYWSKPAYRKEFQKRVDAILNGDVKM